MRNHLNMDVPAGKWEKLFHILALVLFISLIIYIAIIYKGLPEQIPIHLNVKGEADNWGDKLFILIFPLIATPSLIILYFLGKSPQIHNYPVKVTKENARQLYQASRLMFGIMNFELVVMFSIMTWEFVYTAKGNPGLGEWLLVIELAPLLLTMFYFLLRMRKLKP